MAAPDFNVLDFFKSEIKHHKAYVKIAAVTRLNLIASALGPQRTANELIPYIIQVVQEEPLCSDEEFLFNMAKQYAVLMEYIEGSQYHLLISALEHLAAQEETVIRDQAIQSLCTIVERKPSLVPDYLVPTLHQLASKTDFFAARGSACALFPTAYRYASDSQKTGLRKIYNTLCVDDTPMVRRAAAHKMRDFVSVCDKKDILTDVISVYKLLSQDDTQDTIRVACVHTTLVIAQMFNVEENNEHTVSVIKEAAEDRSWRVRLTVAKNFDSFCAAFGPEITAQHLMPPFIQLLKDNEQEVRKEAVRVIEPCITMQVPLSTEQLQAHILPHFATLGLDSAQSVRAALAQVLGPMASALGREATQRQLLPLISDLMKDEFHDVRLNIVSHAGLICEVLGMDPQTHTLLATIQGLIMDNHWRIRQSVVEQVPKLAKQFGPEMFKTKLEALFLSSLRDSVQSVRQAAILNLKEISQTFGGTWTMEHLLPKIKDHYSQNSGYANRVTTLHGLLQLSHAMPAEQIVSGIVPLLIKATKDTVPNVRFCACRTIAWMVEHHQLGAACVDTVISPALRELQCDRDIDVQYYASRALAVCQATP